MTRKKVAAINTIKLIWEEIGKDADGFPQNKEHAIEAYCQQKSVTRIEAYESMRAGVSIQVIFEIRQEDWEETRHILDGNLEYARQVEYEGRRYDIQRTYKIGKSKIEVMCA